MGRKKPINFKNKIVEWEINYQEGNIEIRGINKGKIVSKDKLETVGEPFAVEIETNKKLLEANGLDLAYLKVKVVDQKGRKVYAANHEIIFEVSGAGTLEGLTNGDILSHESFKSSKRKAYNGSCQAVLKSNREKGTILLKAKAEGLKGASIEIQANQITNK